VGIGCRIEFCWELVQLYVGKRILLEVGAGCIKDFLNLRRTIKHQVRVLKEKRERGKRTRNKAHAQRTPAF
jgi:hypothetical protein